MGELIYKRIKDDLLKQIHTVKLRPGERLPSERKLIRKYNVSITSVRRALEILKKGGYIEKRHGSGNYVLDKVRLTGGNSSQTRFLVVGREKYGRDMAMNSLLLPLTNRFEGLKSLSLDSDYISCDQIKQLMNNYRCPIVLLNSRNQTAEMAEAGMLLNWEPYANLMEHIDATPDNIKWRFPGLNGQKCFYACPYTYAPFTMAINLDLAKAAELPTNDAPQTWNELIEWCERFNSWKKRSGNRDVYPAYSRYSDIMLSTFWAYWFMAANGNPFELDKIQLKRTSMEFFSLVERLFQIHAFEMTGLQSPDPFVSGKYLFSLQAGSWLTREINQFSPSLRYKFASPPVPELCRPQFTSIGTSLISVVIPPGMNEPPETVFSIINTMFEPTWHITLADKLCVVPSTLSTFRQMLKSRPKLQPFYNSLMTALEPHCPADERIQGELNELFKLRLADDSLSLTNMVGNFTEFYKKHLSTDNKQ